MRTLLLLGGAPKDVHSKDVLLYFCVVQVSQVEQGYHGCTFDRGFLNLHNSILHASSHESPPTGQLSVASNLRNP